MDQSCAFPSDWETEVRAPRSFLNTPPTVLATGLGQHASPPGSPGAECDHRLKTICGPHGRGSATLKTVLYFILPTTGCFLSSYFLLFIFHSLNPDSQGCMDYFESGSTVLKRQFGDGKIPV